MSIVSRIIDRFKKWVDHGIILKRGQISILIDSKTPCLINRHTSEIVDTFYEELELSDLKKIKKKDGWKFRWTDSFFKEYNIIALKVKSEDAIQGLVAVKVVENAVHIDIVENAPHNYGSQGIYDGVGAHLFAIAIKISFESGCEGYVYFEAKTKLVEYYKKELGAKQVGSTQLMIIEETEALKLFKVYFPESEGINYDEE